MKKFISNSILFLSIFLVGNTLVYLFAQDVYHEAYNKLPDKTFQSFIFADSYAMPLKDYGEDYGVYNFSTPSDSYFDIKRKIIYLIRNDYQIDSVYLAVDNHTLSLNRNQMNNMDRSVYYSTREDFDNSLDYLKDRYIRYYGAIFRPNVRSLLRSYLFQKMKSSINIQPESQSDSSDWSYLTESQRKAEAEAIIEIQFPSQHRSEELENVLEEIIALSKEHHFELIGVKFPITASYFKALDNANYGADELFAAHGISLLNYKK